MRFDQAAAEYVARQEEEAGKNLREKKRQLRQHLIPFFGEKPLSGISSFEIERFKKSNDAPERYVMARIGSSGPLTPMSANRIYSEEHPFRLAENHSTSLNMANRQH